MIRVARELSPSSIAETTWMAVDARHLEFPLCVTLVSRSDALWAMSAEDLIFMYTGMHRHSLDRTRSFIANALPSHFHASYLTLF